MAHLKFDPAKTAKLDDAGRLDDIRPDAMWAALGTPSPRAIIDLGAGTGLFSEEFARLAPEAVLYAVDTSQAMLDWIAEKRAALVDAGRVVTVLADEASVPLADGLADLVVMVNLHHEFESPAASYAEAYRMLADGGQVLVVDWAPRETPKGPPLAVRASAEQIGEVLAGAGFADVVSHDTLPYHSLVTARRAR